MLTIEELNQKVELLSSENEQLKQQLAELSEQAQISMDILRSQRDQAANAAATIQRDLIILQRRTEGK